jgi:predicted DNA binding protein/DNA-binding response OmpR family regulator
MTGTMDSSVDVTERSDSTAPRPVVLIVDDERDLTDTYARWLDQEYDVRTAYGGHEAIESVDEEIDAVLLDRRMPRITGDEVLEHIREEGFDCRVSMLTAVEPDSDISDLGFDEYLVKPVTKADLVDVVDELLLRSSMADDTQEYLALQSTADTMADYQGEGGPDPAAVEAVQERAREAGASPEVQQESAALQRLKKFSGLLRSVNRAVVEVDSRAALDRRVCEQFVDVDSYAFAVVGNYTPEYDEFVPTATNEGELAADTVACGADGALGTALSEGTVQVADADALGDGAVARLREAIGGVPEPESVVAIPVSYRGTVHGGVVVWADASVALGDRERDILAELGTTIGNALDSLRTKEIVHADQVVELELEVADRTDVFVDLSAEHSCRLRLEGLNLSSDDGIVCYLTIETERSDDVVVFLAADDAVANCRTVDDRGEDVLVECTVHDDSILLELLETNGNVTEFFVDEGRGQVSLKVPPTRNLRNVFAALRENFEGIDLVSKRTTDRSYQSVEGFRASLESELTDRQNAVIGAAYRAGYFDWPRESTAEEVAEGLGMAPPTFHEHLREAERKLAGIYLEETT